MEVKDHIERLWEKEKELLELLFGRYYPGGEPLPENDSEAEEGQGKIKPMISDSLGP
jgi:hypothetical protein